MQQVETELFRKEKVIDDLIQSKDSSFGINQAAKFGANGPRIGGVLKAETHLVMNLKRKIRDLKAENERKVSEVEALKKNIRCTRLSEIEVEIKMYMEECARLRNQLEEVIASKDTFADPQELKIIEEKFQQRDNIIAQMQVDTGALVSDFQKKSEENQ